MAKKSIFTILPIAIGALLISGLTACGGDTQHSGDDDSTNNGGEIVTQTFKVNFKDGETVLHTVEVKKDEKTTSWDPSTKVTNKEFFGWYAEPTLKHAFDFNTAITKDTDIFGSFVGYKKDERKWAIAGSGSSSLLKSSNWGKVFTEDHYMKNESTDNSNVYTMTLSLFKGDQFQFTDPVIDGENISWGHQRGAGYLKDDSKNFSGGGSLSGDNSTANMTCEKDGEYKFTLKTYPAGDFQKDNLPELYNNRSYFDKLTVERLGDSKEEKAKVETTMYLKGEKITSWGDYLNANTMMVANPDNANELKLENVYLVAADQFMFASKNKDVATGEVTEGNVYIKSENLTETAKTVAKAKGSNIQVLEDGYYTFTYLVEEKTLDVAKVEYTPKAGEYYLDGTFGGRNWGIDEANKFVKSAEDPFVYTLAKEITVSKGEEIGIQYYDATKGDKGYNGFFSSKNLVKNEAFDTTANNIKVVTAGTYTVSFNSYSHLITITAKAA